MPSASPQNAAQAGYCPDAGLVRMYLRQVVEEAKERARRLIAEEQAAGHREEAAA